MKEFPHATYEIRGSNTLLSETEKKYVKLNLKSNPKLYGAEAALTAEQSAPDKIARVRGLRNIAMYPNGTWGM